jgi:transcriptional regulator with XRE-family HTH domain
MKPTVLKLLGQRIRDLRKQKGISQEQLGEMSGFHFSYIGGLERAEKNITLLNLEKIATALEVTVFELFIYGKQIRFVNNEKDLILNKLNGKLVELKTNELRKVQVLIDELIADK